MIKSRPVRWQWAVFLLCIFAFGLSPVREALKRAEKEYASTVKAEYFVTNIWLLSAECMRQSGVWLAVCEKNELYPIANYAPADDPGPALLLGIMARVKNKTVSLVDVARVNIIINSLGLLIVCTLMMATGSHAAALLMLALGPVVFYAWNTLTPHPVVTGAVCFALLFPLTVLLLNRRLLSVVTGRVLLILSLPLLGVAALLREPVGMMGLIAGMGVLAFDWLAVHRKKKLLSTLILAAMVVLACKTPRFVLMLRDIAFPVHGTAQIQTHGMSHTLYLGLGVVDNKFGIRWDDADGEAAVKAVDPTVSYASEKYFQLLWQLYWQRVQEDPIEVMKIYVKKALQILRQAFPQSGIPLFVLLAGTVVVWLFATHRNLWSRLDYHTCPVMLSVCCLFTGFFVLQGTVAHPDRQYSYPIGVFVLIIIAMLLELWLRGCWKTSHERL